MASTPMNPQTRRPAELVISVSYTHLDVYKRQEQHSHRRINVPCEVELIDGLSVGEQQLCGNVHSTGQGAGVDPGSPENRADNSFCFRHKDPSFS